MHDCKPNPSPSDAGVTDPLLWHLPLHARPGHVRQPSPIATSTAAAGLIKDPAGRPAGAPTKFLFFDEGRRHHDLHLNVPRWPHQPAARPQRATAAPARNGGVAMTAKMLTGIVAAIAAMLVACGGLLSMMVGGAVGAGCAASGRR